jgi:hypothetical protein
MAGIVEPLLVNNLFGRNVPYQLMMTLASQLQVTVSSGVSRDDAFRLVMGELILGAGLVALILHRLFIPG